MSSSDDDDAPRGLGLGYGVKRGRRDKDEAALGVFGDGDEPHQRRGLGSKAKKSSGPVMFVSAGKEEAKFDRADLKERLQRAKAEKQDSEADPQPP